MYARRLRSIALLRRCGTAPARKPRLPPPPPPLTPIWQHPRFFSAEGDGRNNAAGKQVPVKDAAVFDQGKPPKEDSAAASHDYFTEHARLGEIDQREWMRTEKLKMEGRIREPAFATRRQLFKKEFLRRVIPWEKIAVSWDKFPYYIDENVKKLLLECAAAHLKHRNCATMYGAQLHSSRRRILLQTSPGTELYRERVVKALARELQVPLLVLDSSVLAPFDFGDCSETELDEDNDESSEESTSSEAEDENNASNEEEYTDGNETKSGESEEDDEDDERVHNKVLAKIVPVGCTLEEFAKTIQSASEPVQPSGVESSEQSRSLKRGDRVKYIGASVSSEVNRIVLGKIPTLDGSTNAYTCFSRRWVGKFSIIAQGNC